MRHFIDNNDVITVILFNINVETFFTLARHAVETCKGKSLKKLRDLFDYTYLYIRDIRR